MNNVSLQDVVRFHGMTNSLQSFYQFYWQQARKTFNTNMEFIASTSPDILKNTEADVSLQQLQQSSETTLQIIFTQPEMYRWMNQLDRLVTLRPLPIENLQTHLSALARSTTSALILDRRAGSTLLPFDENGCCSLPGCRIILHKRMDDANRIQRCNITDDGLSIASTDGGNFLFCTFEQLDTNIALPTWLHRSVRSRGITVYHEDPLLLETDGGNYTYEIMDMTNQARWQDILESSFHFLEEVLAKGYEEVIAHIRVIIPVVPPKQDSHTSGTSAALPGAIYLSYSDDRLMMAESLIHEYGHNKLNVLLKTDPLVTNALSGPHVYSPWKPVPRPLLGILHGICAFQGVCQLWQAALEHSLPDESRNFVSRRFYQFFRQVQIASLELQEAAAFTSGGELFMTQIESVLTEMSKSLSRIPIDIREPIDQQLARHEQQYRLVEK